MVEVKQLLGGTASEVEVGSNCGRKSGVLSFFHKVGPKTSYK